jgi:hypothetical protein
MSAELDEMIRRLRALPRAVDEALPEAAKELEQIIAGNIAAQRGPDGEKWAPAKDPETTAVLRNAMKNVTVRAIGRVLLARVVGPEARHHLGLIKGRVMRRIIPTAKVPKAMADALRRVVERRLKAVASGG